MLVIALSGCNSSQPNISAVESVLKFFEYGWVEHDYDHALTLANENITQKKLQKEVAKVKKGYWEGNQKLDLLYREKEGKNGYKNFVIYSPSYRVFVNLKVKKTSGEWRVNDVSSEIFSSDDLDKVNDYEWENKEITKQK
ncbi:hypothetical protein JI666_15370 [Bacillus sp. NTK071]|uniref:hypothetical protein n=1 Tax=Bacillus sp. NTK071 TaxID=2802175 RepID=UPI001A8D944E|nr:hypothetical protein [Bacillus sp. NTK071]MBN8210133.1 hypothetical protein [Bacillus sp. NTK071]